MVGSRGTNGTYSEPKELSTDALRLRSRAGPRDAGVRTGNKSHIKVPSQETTVSKGMES